MELTSKLQPRISYHNSYNMNTPKKHLPPDDKRNIFIFQLTPLWEHIVRMKRVPPDVNMDELFVEIRERLNDPEWEVRQHALRVMADLIPVMDKQLDNRMLPLLNNILDNLGHSAPAVRKAALDILKIYFTFSNVPEDLLGAVTKHCGEKCSTLSGEEANDNIVTGVILSLPSLLNIVMSRRRSDESFVLPVYRTLGLKLLVIAHQDVALRSLIKLKNFCGKSKFREYVSMLDSQIRNKYRMLCDVHQLHDCDSSESDKIVGRRDKGISRSNSFCKENMNEYTTDSSEETEFVTSELETRENTRPTEIQHKMSLVALGVDDLNNNVNNLNVQKSIVNGKVIMKTEIAFDSDTAITMTVLEEEKKANGISRSIDSEDESFENSSFNGRSLMKVYSESDTTDEDTDVVVPVQKKVRFGGEEVKLRTPDSDNHLISEDENKQNAEGSNTRESKMADEDFFEKLHKSDTPGTNSKPSNLQSKKSNIPIPISNNQFYNLPRYRTDSLNAILKMPRRKSKSLSELYDYFRNKSKPCHLEGSLSKTRNPTTQNVDNRKLTPLHIPKDYRTEDDIASPLPPHREVEVLHNLQRSPSVSPQRTREKIHFSDESFSLTVYKTESQEYNRELDSDSETSSVIQRLYDWERLNIVPSNVIEQLHNHENWISLVKAVDRLHNFLHLNPDNLRALDAGGGAASLSDHMMSLGAHVAGARSACERVQCVLVRGVSARTLRRLLPRLVGRLAQAPSPLALPHALLARVSLHELVAAVLFGQSMAEISTRDNSEASLTALTAVARAAGPAAVLAAAKQQLAGEEGRQHFCQQLRARLYVKGSDSEESLSADIRLSRIPVLPPIPTQSFLPRPRARLQEQPQQRGRAHSTPPPLRPLPPAHRLRPLTDSASAPTPPAPLAQLQQVPESGQGQYEVAKKPLAFFKLPTSVSVNKSVHDSDGVNTTSRNVEFAPERAIVINKASTDESKVTNGTPNSTNLSKATTASPHSTPSECKYTGRVETNGSLKEYELVNTSKGVIEQLINKSPIKTNDQTGALTPSMSREPSTHSPSSPTSYSKMVSPMETKPNTPQWPSTPNSMRSRMTSDERISRVSSENSFAASSAVSSVATVGDKDSPISYSRPHSRSVQSESPENVSNDLTVPNRILVEPEEIPIQREKPLPPATRVREPSVSREQLARCLALLESDDWEKVTAGLHEVERLCSRAGAASAWRPVVRAVARHVRSLRSQVARAACHTLGRLFEEQGRALENEAEEASAPLLDRTADTNRFLRSDAEAALVQVSASVSTARAVGTLVSRGAGHRSGAVRSASARVLAEVCARAGAARVLSLQTELRARLLRAAADLVSDAGLDTRSHAKKLFIVLAEDPAFYSILKESIPPSKYKSIEKVLNRLRASH